MPRGFVSASIAAIAVLCVAAGARAADAERPAIAAAQPAAAPLPEQSEVLPAGARIETVVSGLQTPVAMAFDPSGRLFFTEQRGRVRLFADGVLQQAPVITFDVLFDIERGLLGIAVDPAFATNRYIYVYYTAPSQAGADTENRVVRFVENNGAGSNPQVIFSSFDSAGSPMHNGGNIHFGPDGKLYISIGDDGEPANSQGVTSRSGKIHRINPDGSIPADNPAFPRPGALGSLYAMGLRNSFDFAFDPIGGGLWASENGPACDDELNRILPAGNYGWRPNYPCDDGQPDPAYNTIAPLWWLPAERCCEGPTGVEFYRGSQIPSWRDDLFMCSVVSGKLRRFRLGAGRTALASIGVIEGVNCRVDIQTGPDGALYYVEWLGSSGEAIKRIVGAGATGTPAATVTATQPTATTTATSCPRQFADVSPQDYFHEPVRYLYCRGVISGYADNTFRPYNSATRGQVVRIVVLAAGRPLLNPPAPSFVDVPPDNPFYPEIETAVEWGIAGGYDLPGGQREFRWFAPVTRGQLAKIVVRAAGWSLLDPARPTFEDVPPGSVFYREVETAAARGIAGGYELPDGRREFRWYSHATRGQLAAVVYQAFSLLALQPPGTALHTAAARNPMPRTHTHRPR